MDKEEFWEKLGKEMIQFGKLTNLAVHTRTIVFTLELDISSSPDQAYKANCLKQLRICLNALGIPPSHTTDLFDYLMKHKDKFVIRYILPKPTTVNWDHEPALT